MLLIQGFERKVETMKLGFIGTGNMGGALAKAAAGSFSGEDILLANRSPEKAERLAAELGAQVVDNLRAAEEADYLFLGVKPQVLPELMAEIAPVLARRERRFALVSMAAGVTIARVQELAGMGELCPVIRIMPNTPVSIGAGMTLYSLGPGLTEREVSLFKKILSPASRLLEVPESRMDAGAAVTGCGPAFVDLFVEALADGGVACGLPRAEALELAAQMTMGAALLILQSGAHPGELKDAVCSPGGSTIQGVRKLEEAGFRGAVMNAVIAACEKNGNLK